MNCTIRRKMSRKKDKESPKVKVFLFSVPVVGVGYDSDSAFCHALSRLVREPEAVIRGDIMFDVIDDDDACQEELGRALASEWLSAMDSMVPVDTDAIA